MVALLPAALATLLFVSSRASAAPVDQSVLALASLPYEPENKGQLGPLLPANDYAFSFTQHKLNQNGAGQNHISTGTWYSSAKSGKVRVDTTTLDWVSDNATVAGNIGGAYSSSLFDFADPQAAPKGNVKNSYYASPVQGVVGQGACNVTDLPIGAAQAQLFPADFLRTQGTFIGTELLPQYGQSEKWMVFFGQGLVLSFYFVTDPNSDHTKRWVRYDQYSSGLQTTVITHVYNLRENIAFENGIFTPCKSQ